MPASPAPSDSPAVPRPRRGRPPANKVSQTDAMLRAMDDVLIAIRSLQDKTGRKISELFEELVSRDDYPEYYEIIQQPIALEVIQEKIDRREYRTMEEFQADMELLIENAKTFNRKGSTVYKDAVTLQGAFELELAAHSQKLPNRSGEVLNSQASVSPDTSNEKLVNEFRNILRTITTRKNDEGRIISEMFQELPDKDEYPDYYDEIKNPISLDIIQQKIDRKAYHSVAEFEADFMRMVSNAMEYNAEGSEVYQDAIALQMLFNELMKKRHGNDAKDDLKVSSPALTVDGQTYEPGDFVYIFNPNDPMKPTVAQIISVWSKQHPVPREGVSACWFLRPEQTVHRANTKFMHNEVFKTNHTENYYANEIVGRCWVLYIRDYVRGRPKGASKDDVYVCESRYNEQAKQYSKIKNWLTCIPEVARHKQLDLELFPTPIVPLRLYSAFDESTNQGRTRKGSEDAQSIAERPATPKPQSPRKIPGTAPASLIQLKTPAVQLHATSTPGATAASIPSTWTTGATPSTPLIVSPLTPTVPHTATAQSYVPSTLGLGTSNTGAPVTPYFTKPPKSTPTPSSQGYDNLPVTTIDCFDTTDDKKLKWFAAPPLDMVDNWTAIHSLEYLYRKAQEKRRRRGSLELRQNAGSGKRLKKLKVEAQKASSAEIKSLS
ncbi:uncharacterized protein SPPG_03301 [Spizellomyces punctatus DAOM BR117]|uniref:Bromo domain-containing protein n=1 Tax=Spizellomyces punctatus (strain DAOM BR117) TaxID=645134 RepID=A0A0L0HJ59_SPIPD|nr:uncharacterized protein SPPG_03301 [Spizellomyces punctatus DAOM BR117]KND01501.1 hypothetical protein SPPG_03301 [Spizellomyces punctatus DAOM BR117]|eukprot:XP_016609540.1 hypothetical protein SPPG_03301 [Spizellomyces punctatus DAOM BR117]